MSTDIHAIPDYKDNTFIEGAAFEKTVLEAYNEVGFMKDAHNSSDISDSTSPDSRRGSGRRCIINSDGTCN
jgi:hypothetical protein